MHVVELNYAFSIRRQHDAMVEFWQNGMFLSSDPQGQNGENTLTDHAPSSLLRVASSHTIESEISNHQSNAHVSAVLHHLMCTCTYCITFLSFVPLSLYEYPPNAQQCPFSYPLSLCFCSSASLNFSFSAFFLFSSHTSLWLCGSSGTPSPSLSLSMLGCYKFTFVCVKSQTLKAFVDLRRWVFKFLWFSSRLGKLWKWVPFFFLFCRSMILLDFVQFFTDYQRPKELCDFKNNRFFVFLIFVVAGVPCLKICGFFNKKRGERWIATTGTNRWTPWQAARRGVGWNQWFVLNLVDWVSQTTLPSITTWGAPSGIYFSIF